MDILLLIAITFAAGIVGGLVIAEAMDLETLPRQRRDRRERRRARRQARKNVNFTKTFY